MVKMFNCRICYRAEQSDCRSQIGNEEPLLSYCFFPTAPETSSNDSLSLPLSTNDVT
jgi:hypothetical protein